MFQQDAAILFDAIQAPKQCKGGKHDSSLHPATWRPPNLLDASQLGCNPLKGRRFAVIAEAIGDCHSFLLFSYIFMNMVLGEGLAPGVKESFMDSVRQIERLGVSYQRNLKCLSLTF